MTGELVVQEGEPFALEPTDALYLSKLLGGRCTVLGGKVEIARVVGHVALPSGRVLRIRSPKAPVAALLAWAAYVDPSLRELRILADRLPGSSEKGDLSSLLARLFTDQLETAIVQHGLLRQYSRARAELETIRGRIDFAAVARNGGDLSRMPCEYWERSEGTRLNQLFAATVLACSRDPVMREAALPALSRLRARMSGIAPAIDAELLAGVRPLDRALLPFAAALALARMVLRCLGLSDGAHLDSHAFLVNLEALFEQAVVRALTENELDVLAKAPIDYWRATDTGGRRGGDAFELDVLCRNLGDTDVIVDAKFKQSISSSNLHQAVAYCALLGTTRAAFVVPAGMIASRSAYLFESVAPTRTLRVSVLELETDGTSVAAWRERGRALACRLREEMR